MFETFVINLTLHSNIAIYCTSIYLFSISQTLHFASALGQPVHHCAAVRVIDATPHSKAFHLFSVCPAEQCLAKNHTYRCSPWAAVIIVLGLRIHGSHADSCGGRRRGIGRAKRPAAAGGAKAAASRRELCAGRFIHILRVRAV